MAEHIKTQAELDLLCQEWQTLLGLGSWDVTTRITRAKDMSVADSDGTNSMNFDHELSVIDILHPMDYASNLGATQDMEFTLVHELLHLVLYVAAPESFDELRSQLFEQALNRLAKVMLTLKRSRREEEN